MTINRLIFIATFLISSASLAFECKAIHRHIEGDGKFVEVESKLVKTYDVAGTTKFEGELMSQLYFLIFDKDQESALMQIINANDYTKGIVSRSAFDNNGVMALSWVDNQTLDRLECKAK